METHPTLLPLHGDDYALIRLEVPDGMAPVGINDNLVVFADDAGRERRYEIPVFENMPCSIKTVRILSDVAGLIDHKCILPDKFGAYQLVLSVEPGGGAYWVIITLTERT